ncbi:hypothetical protein ACFQ0B_45430 [Nonomuraea thailandensis]
MAVNPAPGPPARGVERLVREIREEAERARATPAPELTDALWRSFAETGDRLAYERAYFDRRRRLAALALDAHLDALPGAPLYTRPGAHLDTRLAVRAGPALDGLLWSVCEERTWVLPAHEPGDRPLDTFVDLFAAETAHTLAEIVALLPDHLDPAVRDRVRVEVDRRVLRPLRPGSPRCGGSRPTTTGRPSARARRDWPHSPWTHPAPRRHPAPRTRPTPWRRPAPWARPMPWTRPACPCCCPA